VRRLLAFALWALALLPLPLDGQSGRLWRPDERVLLTDFSRVGAVASDSRRIWAATPLGVEVYDFVARRWDPPVTAEDGYPFGETPTALAYDRFADVLLLGTAAGTVYEYQPLGGSWRSVGPIVIGPVMRIVVAEGDDGVLVAGRDGWRRLRRESYIPEPVPPGELPPAARAAAASPVERLIRADAGFAAARGTLAVDEHARDWPLTDVAEGGSAGEYWIGTWGDNLIRYDAHFMRAERFRFGPLSAGVGAIARDANGWWFAGDGRGPRDGVAHADPALQEWRYHEARVAGAPRGHVRAVSPTSRIVWFAATAGLFRLERATGSWQRIGEADGLPAAEVMSLAVAPGPDGVWAGTRRGLVFVPADGTPLSDPVLAMRRIHHVRASADTLWISADDGLWILPLAEPDLAPRRAPGSAHIPPLRTRVLDARPAPGGVRAITESGLYVEDGGVWSGPVRAPALDAIGRPHSLATADGQLWVAGDLGVARLDTRSGLWTAYLVGQDIPLGPVHDVVPAGDDVWIATGAGALRLRWRD